LAKGVLRWFDTIEPKPLRYLWPGRIPAGKITLLMGDPGKGKSLMTNDVAARVSKGTAFPDGSLCEQGRVIILSAEDDEADTIRPRLDAAGADCRAIALLESVQRLKRDSSGRLRPHESMITLADIEVLAETQKRAEAKLIVIDPISAYLGGVDSHNNAEVRSLLFPLKKLASRTGVAIVAITHFRKSAGPTIYRAVESIAFTAAARSLWAVGEDPEDRERKLLLPVKQNLTANIGGLAYRIEAVNGVARIKWEEGPVFDEVDTILGEEREEYCRRKEAAEWLGEYLAQSGQPVPARKVITAAKAVGVSEAALWRASDKLRVLKRKPGGSGVGWEWSLPSKPRNPVEANSLNSLDNPLKPLGEFKEFTSQSEIFGKSLNPVERFKDFKEFTSGPANSLPDQVEEL
jgi:putative DNA primase/helicase